MLDHKQPIETGPVPEDGSQFDVIVVGGGPGGSAAAAFNAMNGCKVLLIEKGVWPRDKPCGDAVGGKSLSHAKELGVLELIDESPHYVVDSIVFGSANGSEVRVDIHYLESNLTISCSISVKILSERMAGL